MPLGRRFFSAVTKSNLKAALVVQRGPLQIARQDDFESHYAAYRVGLEPALTKGPLKFPDLEDKPAEQGQDLPVTAEPRPMDNTNLQNYKRLPEKKVYFMIKDRSNKWNFPEGQYANEAGLHETAEKLINPNFTISTKLHLMKPPVAADANTFYFSANFIRGSPSTESFAWLAKDEIEQYNPQLFAKISRILDS